MRKAIFACWLIYPLVVSASESLPDNQAAEKRESPWLLTPLVTSAPKFGTAVGAMGAYLKKFDEASPTSMFGAAA